MARRSVRAFRGNPDVTITDITMGTIASSRTSCVGLPAFFQLSASAVTATGSSRPYEDLEFRWERVGGTTGYNTFSLSYNEQVLNGTTRSTTFDADTDQVGPECAVRCMTTGTHTWRLTVRGSDGAGGYITNSTTIDLTVTAISAANHFWYDPDAGNNANDGKDPHGFAVTTGTLSGADVAVGLYEIVSKDSNDQLTVRISAGDDRTLTKTGAFTAYDHAAAIAPTDILARTNFIGITAGTAAGGISTSNGPKASSAGTELADNVVLHFKGGNTAAHTWPTSANYRAKDNIRLLAYGTDRAYSNTGHTFNMASGSHGTTNAVWHRINIDGGAASINPWNATSSAGNLCSDIYISDWNIEDLDTAHCLRLGTISDRCGVWGCTLNNPVGASSAHGILGGCTSWAFVIGCSITGIGTDDTLHHHVYLSVTNHSLYRWITFGAATDRNYCINTNYDGSAGSQGDYHNISECLITGTLRAWDASNASNDPAVSQFRNFVAEGNIITGLSGLFIGLFYTASTMTVRDNVYYANSAGGWIGPNDPGCIFRCYANKIYCASGDGSTNPLVDLSALDTTAGSLFRNNQVWDDRGSNVESLELDFDNQDIDGNTLHTPNNAGTVVTDDTAGVDSNRTFAQFVAEADANAVSAQPNWEDPDNGLFEYESSGASGSLRFATRFLLGI